MTEDTKPLTMGDQNLRQEVIEFLNREAELIDNKQLSAWLDMLADDIEYRMPVRQSHEMNSQNEFSKDAYHLAGDKEILEAHVAHLETDYSWSENPPSRTRRFISNYRIGEKKRGDIEAKTNIMVYRSQGDTVDYSLLTGERHDLIRRDGGELKLAERTVYFDHTILDIEYLSPLMFL